MRRQFLEGLSLFARADFAGGNVQPYEFATIGRTMDGGLWLQGQCWGREKNTVALAKIANGLSLAR